jgi:hypothetical protein
MHERDDDMWRTGTGLLRFDLLELVDVLLLWSPWQPMPFQYLQQHDAIHLHAVWR